MRSHIEPVGAGPARAHGELLSRIRTAGEVWRRRSAADGLLRVAAFAVVVFAAYLVLDALFVLPPAARVVWLVALAAFLVLGLAVRVARPLVRVLDPVKIAARIEAAHPELGEMLESAAELWAKRGTGKAGYSIALIDALVEKAFADSVSKDFGRAGGARLGRAARAFGIALALSVAGLACVGARLGPALDRLSAPLTLAEGARVTIEVSPGDTTLVSGEDLAVEAKVVGPADLRPVLRCRFAGEAPTEREMTHARAGAPYRATVADLRSALEYSVAAGDAESPRYSVRVIDRPFVSGIRLDYEFPAYSGLLLRTVDEGSGDITALKGTKVGVTVTASKPLERAWLTLGSGKKVELSREGAKAFKGTLFVVGDDTYAVSVLDADGLENPDPPSYSIVAVRDEVPLVKIVEPGGDREISSGMTLPLAVSAVDDYGVSRLSVRYSIEGEAEEGVLPLEEPGPHGPRELEARADWDLSETGILPGTVLVYFAEVVDNDAVSGPKVARSESYLVRFPSMGELYEKVTDEQDDMVSDLEDVLDKEKSVKEEFGDIQEKLKSTPAIDWQEQEKVDTALDRQQDVAGEVAQMAERMANLTETMSDTDRVTLETLEKMQEVAKLLDEVATKEMRDLIQEIRQAMQDLAPEDVSRAMQEMNVTQDDYLRRLEQTLNLLRRVKAEQDLADVANRAEDLAGREQKIADDAAKSPDAEQCQSLAQDQAGVKEETEKLRKDLEKAIQAMSQVDKTAAEDMKSAAAEMDSAGTTGKMEEARKRLAEMKPEDAQPQCAGASNDLLTLFTKLSTCQGGMACQLQSRDRAATLRAIDELLVVSREQEAVLGAVEDRRRIPRDEIVELVAKETDLMESLSGIAERMFTISKDSFVIDPSVYRAFGIVQVMMARAAEGLAGGGTSAGEKDAREALGRVNGLVVELLTANQSNSSKSGGSSLQQLMQQLRQMATQQSQLTDATEELRRQMEELGMGSQFSRQLAEIRGQQEQVLEEARRLAKEFGDRREILGRLDDTVKEMENALAEMDRSGASQETVDRQKRILSRLLDAQRSLRKRDYTAERRSTPGEEYVRTGPGALPEDLTRATQELREDLLKAMQRDYPPEYRELIRAYFDGLSKDVESRGGEGVRQ